MNKTLKNLKKLAKLTSKVNELHKVLDSAEIFDDCMWDVTGVYKKCTVKDGVLYDNNGNKLSSNGECMDEEIPYFVNQCTGYCEDDYYGTLYVKVDNKNTFIAVSYSC